MSTPTARPEISVVVVSRGRPAALAACLASLSAQDHPAFEAIVVADPAGLAAVPPGPRAVPFDEPNISAARNAGLDVARGTAVAFLDDDAVAPSGWLSRLGEALALPGASAVAGWVRGPRGDWAARARMVDEAGASREVAADPEAATLLRPAPGAMPRAEGTNMAVRADLLRALGGFDPAYRFSHDETDLFWRLGAAGHATASAPLAWLRHGALPSERRRADRVALSLFEVGASIAVWGRRRGLADLRLPLAAERAARRRTALRQMVQGRIEPRDVTRLLASLEAGFAAGVDRPLPPLAARPAPPADA